MNARGPRSQRCRPQCRDARSLVRSPRARYAWATTGNAGEHMTVESQGLLTSQGMADFWNRTSHYDVWVKSTGVPVHDGYFIEDVRTLKLGAWDERECDAAFLKLTGQEGYTEARVHEIPAGATLPSLKFSIDEAVYVV